MFTDVLKGVKVVELATYVAAPGAARILSEWGAEVIKVESGGGDPWRYFGPTMGVPIADDENPYYDLSNANKKGRETWLLTSVRRTLRLQHTSRGKSIRKAFVR